MGLFTFRKKPKPKGFSKDPFEGVNLDLKPTKLQSEQNEFAVPDFSDEILSAPKPPEQTKEPELPETQEKPILDQAEELLEPKLVEPEQPTEPEGFGVQQPIEPQPVEEPVEEPEIQPEPVQEQAPSEVQEEPQVESFAESPSFWAEEGKPAEDVVEIPETVTEEAPKNIVIKTENSLDIYVEKEQYEDVLLKVASIETDVKKAAQHIGRFADNEVIINSKLAEWKKVLLIIQEKLMQVDAQIFEKGEIHG